MRAWRARELAKAQAAPGDDRYHQLREAGGAMSLAQIRADVLDEPADRIDEALTGK